MRLILLRHGQTDWNAQERYQGRTDIRLNQTGVRQAEEAGRRLAEVRIDRAFSSPLLRARRTAEIALQGHGLDLTLDDGLMETAGGSWEGLTYAQISARWPEDFAAWRAAHPEHGPVGGETPGEAGARVIDTLRGHLQDSHATTALVVAHGGCLRAAAALLTGGGMESYGRLDRLQNGRMIDVEGTFTPAQGRVHGDWRVLGYNV